MPAFSAASGERRAISAPSIDAGVAQHRLCGSM
jgi:hypothetical protein